MGIKAKNGIVLAVEKKQKSFLYDEASINKVGQYSRLILVTSILYTVHK